MSIFSYSRDYGISVVLDTNVEQLEEEAIHFLSSSDPRGERRKGFSTAKYTLY